MPIDKFGFLGQEITKKKSELENKFKDIFKECYRVNEFAQNVKFNFEINKQNAQEVYAVCCFIKILNGFQASIILLRYGLTIESNLILRCLLETFIILKNICETEGFVKDYIQSDAISRLRSMNVSANSKEEKFQDLKNYATKERIEELKNEIKRKNIKNLNSAELAEKVGLKDFYDKIYRLLSEISVHATPRAMEEYLITDKNQNITSFHLSPMEEDISTVLITEAEILLLTLKLILRVFNIKKLDNVETFEKKLKKLSIKYNKNDNL